MRYLAGRAALVWVMGTVIAAGAAAADAQDSTAAIAALTDWVIVGADDALPSEQYAAKEFQRLWQLACGTVLPITNHKRADGGQVLIGPGAADLPTDDLGEEGLLISIEPNAIAITGGRPRGTLYGVYEFFETYLGVRFLTTDHTYVPADAADRTLACGPYRYVPPFDFRWSYFWENNNDPAFAARLRCNKNSFLAGSFPEVYGGQSAQELINHSFQWQLPASKYGQEHPEYYLMLDGRRRPDLQDAWGPNPNPCYATPAVLDIISEAAIGYLNDNPHLRNVSVSCTDTSKHCRCPQCQAINDAQESPCGSHLDFVNKVADRVAAVHPDRYVGTLAYFHTRKPPKTIRPRPNVQIQLCSIEACVLHALDDPDCPENVAFCRDLRAWGEICESIYIWNYNINFHYYGLPFPNFRSIGENVRFFRDHHVKGVFMQGAGNGRTSELCDLRNYVIARCLWKPGRNSWREMLEFCRLHYEQASEPIIAWLTYFHDYLEARGIHENCFPHPEELALTPEVAMTCRRYFQEALELAGPDPTLRARVEKASLSAYLALIESAPRQLVNGEYRLTFPEECGDVLADYRLLRQRYHVGMSSERENADWLDRRTRTWRIVEIENDQWQLRVSPDRNGGVFGLLHKPSGRQLLDLRLEQGSYTRNRGVLSESYEGLESEWAPRFGFQLTFDIEQDGKRLILTKTFEDGATLVREIGLQEAQVAFRTTFTAGSQPRTFGVRVVPEFDTATTDFETLELCAKTAAGWRYARPADLGPDEPSKTINGADDNRYAFFNTRDSFGVQLSYDTDGFASRQLWLRPAWRQLNLELQSKPFDLSPGQSVTLEYRLDYLTQRPQ